MMRALPLVLLALLVASPVEARHRHHYAAYPIIDIGGRPAGCPHAYCGCGLRKYLGLADVDLNLARAWGRKFSRTTPRSGAVAVRRHHVFLLEEHVKGRLWKVRDFNSGGHRSHIHVRSIAGYAIVDPRRKFAD